MMLAIQQDPGTHLYEVYDVDDDNHERLGFGSSPDEAIGNAVREIHLSGEDVLITEIENFDELVNLTTGPGGTEKRLQKHIERIEKRLQLLFYLLLRDELPDGKIQRIMLEINDWDGEQALMYSTSSLESLAESHAWNITRKGDKVKNETQ